MWSWKDVELRMWSCRRCALGTRRALQTLLAQQRTSFEEEAHHRLLSGGHHHVDPYLDVQVSVGICAVLISVTVIFEVAKHKVEHDTPPVYQAVLQAMFGELTVLGFIALYTYFMLKFGVLKWCSLQIYHDPEHMIHLFEDIHFFWRAAPGGPCADFVATLCMAAIAASRSVLV